ncbi:MAG: hypothetical protein H6636_10345 [Anaerolineales bacterium]|nr:hypothetical protein [Anaerolineales bacterium]
MPKPRLIGTLSEKSLHAALKAYLSQPGDLLESTLDGYVIDLLRGEQIIEVQTGNFSAMKRKLGKLLGAGHAVRVVHPLAVGKWIVRQSESGELIGRRKSPKQRQPVEVFRQLVYIPHILPHPHFTLEILFTHQEEIWRDDGHGSWRRKGWSLYDHRLLEVVGNLTLATPEEFLALLPDNLPDPFTNRQLATALNISPGLAGKMTYTLRGAGWLAEVGKKGKANLFSTPPHLSTTLDINHV